ncbi:hypothetical protein [Pedobacter chinensis]|nr:hypothetical protein [Pedobacter chinensis]
MMIVIILQATKGENFKDGIYLGLAFGAAIIIFLLSRKFRRKN